MDYIFYRIYEYYNRKKDDIPIATAILFLQAIKISFLFLIGTIINLITHGFLSSQSPNLKKEYYWIGFALLISILLVIDILRYSKIKNVKMLEEMFQKRKINDTIKIWQIFLTPVLLLMLSFLLIVLFGK